MNATSLYFTLGLTLLNMTGVQAGRVLLTLYALKLGAQPFAVGILASLFSLLPMLLSWQVGRLTDRFGSRWPLTFGAAGGACGMLVPYVIPELPALFAAAVMNGLSFAFYGVALQNLVGLLSRSETRTVNFSNFSLTVSVSSFVGPMLAGFAIDASGPAQSCLYLAVLSLAPVIMLLLRGAILPGGTHRASPAARLRDLLTGSGLGRILITSSLVVTGIALFQFYMPIYSHDIGLSASTIGIVLAMFSAAAFLVRSLMPRLIARFGEEKMLGFSFFIGAASLTLIPFFTNAVMLALLSFLFGLGMGCGQPITIMLTFSTSAAGHSGEALGLRITANHTARMAGPLLFGAIGSVFGLFPLFWLNALMLLAGGGLTVTGKTVRKAQISVPRNCPPPS